MGVMATIDKDKVGKPIGKIAGGLYIVNCKCGDDEAGFLASWVQQAGFEPPMLTLAVNHKRDFFLKLLKEGKNFTINIMGKANSKSMSPFFKHDDDKSPYDGLETMSNGSNVKILKDSVGYIECEYKNHMEAGDHVIVLAEIKDGDMLMTEVEPSCHYRDNGFHY